MSELAVEALREAGRLADENSALRTRLAEAERVCDSYAAENQRLFDKAEAAEAALAKAREALEDIEKVSAEDHIKAIARAALRSMKEQDG